jgi:hypothetical protein
MFPLQEEVEHEHVAVVNGVQASLNNCFSLVASILGYGGRVAL